MTAALPATETSGRAQQLWDEEVATVLAVAPTLSEAARIALCSVLRSIASESTDAATALDVRAMLAAVSGSIRLTVAAEQQPLQQGRLHASSAAPPITSVLGLSTS